MRTFTWTLVWVAAAALWMQVISGGGPRFRFAFHYGGGEFSAAVEKLR